MKSVTLPPPKPLAEPLTPLSVAAEDAAWLAIVAKRVRELQFGTIQITIHDSRVVQVETTERHRFEPRRST